jgi:hypothetical protein
MVIEEVVEVNADVNARRAEILAKARQARRNRPHPSITTIDELAQNRLALLNPARRSAVEARLAGMPPTCRNTYLRAVGGRSPRAAIKSFCLECVGWQRRDVALCTAAACPLWAYRPFRKQ